MKNLFIALIGLIIVVGGCKTVEQATEVGIRSAPDSDGLYFWTQDIRPQVKDTDPWSFYNSSEIKLETSVARGSDQFVDGALVQNDTIKNLVRIVYAKTPGHIVPRGITKDPSGKITSLRVLYSLNNATYTFDWKISSDGTALIDKSKKALIVFEGKSYNAPIRAETDCRLKVKWFHDTVTETDVDAAEGVHPDIVPPKR